MDPKLALAMMLNPSETIANINDEALMDIYGLAYVEIYGNDGQPVNCDELRTTHIAKMNEIPDHIFAVVSEFWLETLAIEDLPPTARAVAQTIVDKVSAHVKVCDHHADPGDFAKAGCDYLAETQADYRLQIANPEAYEAANTEPEVFNMDAQALSAALGMAMDTTPVGVVADEDEWVH